MGETSIEWSEYTWNCIRGCSRVSRGCEHCYAETVARRFSGPGQPYEGLVRLDAEGRAKAQWNGTVRFVEEHLGDPLRWTRPRKVFVNSMSDLFHEALRFEDIAAIFGVMAAAPKHTFQVLTKRPQRARAFFDWYEGESGAGASPYAAVCTAREALANAGEKHVRDALSGAGEDWPLPNVWLGVSVEDQASADERIPELLACPAAVRWVSYEPALGPCDLSAWMPWARCHEPNGSGGDDADDNRRSCGWRGGLAAAVAAGTERDRKQGITACPRCGSYAIGEHPEGLDWIVVGGESGPGARPFDLAWARSVIAQCREAGTAAFFKQAGACPVLDGVPMRLRDRKGGTLAELPSDLAVREFPHAVR